MTKRLMLILSAIMAALCLFAPGALAETENGFTYTVMDDCATVTGYDGTDTALVVPGTLGGYPVTTIGSNALRGKSFTSVTLPDSLTDIDSGAFDNCDSLKEINIPEGVTYIGASAFYDCGALGEITFPESVAYIGEYAFYNVRLSSVTFDGCSPEVASNAFYLCSSLKQVYASSLGAWVATAFGNQYANPLYYANSLYVDGALVTEAIIPEGVTSIGSYAFYDYDAMTSVVIPESVVSVGTYAFYGCSGLNTLDLPDNIETVGSNAFYNCSAPIEIGFATETAKALSKAGIKFIDPAYPDFIFSYSDDFGVTLADYTGSDASVMIPEGVACIGVNAFNGCTSLTSVTLPDSVTTIDKYAFYGCTALTSVTFPSSMEYVASQAFYRCSNLQEVHAPSLSAWVGIQFVDSYSNPLRYASSGLFIGGELLTEAVIPEGTADIWDYAFYGYKKLTSVTLPESVTYIGEYAFYNCSALKNVSLPSGITGMDATSFSGCPATLYAAIGSETAQAISETGNWFIDPQYPLFSLKYDSTYGMSLMRYAGSDTGIVIPEGIEHIGNNVFEYTNITSIAFPESLTSIGSSAFYQCSSLKKVEVPTLEAWLNMQFDSYWSSPMNYADTLYIGGELLTNLVIPEGTTAIGNYLFKNCKNLQSVTIPASLTSIGTEAFYNCQKLKKVYVPTLEDWLEISFGNWSATPMCNADDLYIGGSPLTTLVLPEGTTEIDAYRFRNCKSLQSVTFPASLTSIGESVFNGCESIKKVSIPTLDAWLGITFTGSGSNPLHNSSAENRTLYIGGKPLERLVLPEGMTTINRSQFSGCTTLTSIDFPDTLTTIGEYAFQYCPNIKSVTLPDGVHTVGESAFTGGVDVEFHLPDNITSAKSGSFGYNSPILFVTPGSVTMSTLLNLNSTNYAFCDPSDPDWLWKYDENGVRMLGGYRGKKTSITLPAGVTAIADNAFDHERDDKLVSIIIPEGYEHIGRWAFQANNLSYISLPSTLRIIESHAFWGCDFTAIQLPEGLETIGKEAFSACHDLTSLTIPSTVTRIDDIIANEHSDITTVVLPAEIEYIAPNAFGGSLSTVYCYRNTYAQEWAKENSPLVRLIGEGTLEDLVKLTMTVHNDEHIIFDVGSTFVFMTRVSAGTLPLGANYTFTCKSSDPSVARVDGDVLTFLKPGKVTITIGIAERPDVTPLKRTLEVYNPVTSFTVPEAVFVHVDSTKDTMIIPENIEPTKDANPYFRRIDNGDDYWEWCNVKEDVSYRDKGVYFWSDGKLGAVKSEIESMSGVRQPILFVTYDTIGEVYANPPTRPLVIGQIWEPDVTVMVDGSELEKLSYLYTLKTSNAKVAAITEDEMILAVAPGTATITVTARNSGKTAKFTVTVTEAVTLNLPASLRAVADESFIGMAASEVIIPDGCASIGARAFADCENLTDVTIPASVAAIAADAFEGCTGVTITTPAGSAAAQLFDGMEGFTVVTE